MLPRRLCQGFTGVLGSLQGLGGLSCGALPLAAASSACAAPAELLHTVCQVQSASAVLRAWPGRLLQLLGTGLQQQHRYSTTAGPPWLTDASAEQAQPQAQTPPPSIVLSAEQQSAVDLILSGRNILLTGCAGTGKSATLRAALAALRAKYGVAYAAKVAVTGMTGMAATHVNGVTLHSLLGLGTLEDAHHDFQRMHAQQQQDGDTRGRRRRSYAESLEQLDVLLIDEASMLSAELLQMLHINLSKVREARHGVGRPFGGLQIILSGDPFQLPPIVKDKHVRPPHAGRRGCHPWDGRHRTPFLNRGYLFEAPVFYELHTHQQCDQAGQSGGGSGSGSGSGSGGFAMVELTQVFRQGNAEFVALLNDIRCGTPEQAQAAFATIYQHCSRPLDCSDGLKPTKLFALNADVDRCNKEELDRLPGHAEMSHALDDVFVTYEPPASVYDELVASGEVTQQELEQVLEDIKATVALHDGEDQYRKCEWATQALLKLSPAGRKMRNVREDWRAGTREELEEEVKRGLFKQCLAAQKVVLKVGAQVMLLRNLDTQMKLVNGACGVVTRFVPLTHQMQHALLKKARDMDCGREMQSWISINRQGQGGEPCVPVVRFTTDDGPREVPIEPVAFRTRVPWMGQCIRVQVPLRLSYALTVHKAQGTTLEHAVVSAEALWAHGQVYTALSRVRSMEGLQLIGQYNPRAHKVCEVVRRWHAATRHGRPWQPRPHPPLARGEVLDASGKPSPWIWKQLNLA